HLLPGRPAQRQEGAAAQSPQAGHRGARQLGQQLGQRFASALGAIAGDHRRRRGLILTRGRRGGGGRGDHGLVGGGGRGGGRGSGRVGDGDEATVARRLRAGGRDPHNEGQPQRHAGGSRGVVSRRPLVVHGPPSSMGGPRGEMGGTETGDDERQLPARTYPPP